MVTVRTLIGTYESARHDRVEPTGNITATNTQKALEGLDTSVSALSGAVFLNARTQRRIASSADLPVRSTDSILNCSLSAPLAMTIPAASGRAGAPLTIKDVGGNFATNNVTLSRAGADTFDGLTTLVLKNIGMAVTLVPFNDGTSTGWGIE